jgi:predicted membrane metal-binding protein
VSAFTPLDWFFWALAVAALIVEVWAFADAVRRPTAAFPAAGKQTKPLWLIILGVAAAIGLYSATGTSGIGVVVSILPVAAFIAAAIYLTDVRPKVREMGGRGGSSHQGPYGPW